LQDWPPQQDIPGVPIQHRRPLVFTHLKLEGTADGDPRVATCPDDVPRSYLLHVLGYIPPTQDFHAYDSDETRNMVCWPTRDFGIMNGCSHGCFYCSDGYAGKFLALGMNIQEYMEKIVGPTIEAMPQQRCFRLIGWQADIISLEPEYGAFASFLAKLAQYPDRYGYFHSNSDNVDWVQNVPHRDRLIGVWSLASEQVARLVEPASPSASARIEAMRKLNDWGVPVRVKFKPVVPIVGWRHDYARLIDQLFTRAKPETIGFCCLIWMSLETLKQRFDGLIDPQFMQAAEDAAEEMKDQTHSPFPHAVRADMYRHLIAEVRKHDPRIPIFLSTETREMWVELEKEVGQKATSFLCGCNPVQVPGPRLHLTEGIRRSTFFLPGSSPTAQQHPQ
jgi:DNA repair photolyase